MKRKSAEHLKVLEKVPSGISGLDEITEGGLPKGRTCLVCGGAGAGKSLLAIEFLVRGAERYGEPGVLMAFEETEDELARNVASLGFDLKSLIAKKKLVVDFVRVARHEIEETGEYDLEGLFVRLNHSIEMVGARRVVLDTIESLFGSLPNEAILRAELRRLFGWLKSKGVTAIITAERGEGSLTRYGLEDYVADCVILLDHRVENQVSTRRLRVVKYRGSFHGTNEYPFLISPEGLSVLPITSLGLKHPASRQYTSTGIAKLDEMLVGKGYFRGSSVLISGMAGSGKTSIAAAFVNSAARRGERALYFSFEESPLQVVRNMKSIGFDLGKWEHAGLLSFHAARPTVHGLEMHLLKIHAHIRKEKPRVVVFDPITNLITVGTPGEARSMLTRLIDFLKTEQITALFTSLTEAGAPEAETPVGVSSLMDTWLLLRNIESGGERDRVLYVLKSRGMAHSNQVREFILSDQGIDLVDIYTGSGVVLTGSARMTQEALEAAEAAVRGEEVDRYRREIARQRQVAEARIAAIRAEVEAKTEALDQEIKRASLVESNLRKDRLQMAARRGGVGRVHVGVLPLKESGNNEKS